MYLIIEDDELTQVTELTKQDEEDAENGLVDIVIFEDGKFLRFDGRDNIYERIFQV